MFYYPSTFIIPCLQSAGGGFDIRYSLFICSFFDLTVRSTVSGCLFLNIEYRTRNIE